ncbi:MAG: hypothetical protein RL367_1588, partial [Pseudomonadota bacterium]
PCSSDPPYQQRPVPPVWLFRQPCSTVRAGSGGPLYDGRNVLLACGSSRTHCQGKGANCEANDACRGHGIFVGNIINNHKLRHPQWIIQVLATCGLDAM